MQGDKHDFDAGCLRLTMRASATPFSVPVPKFTRVTITRIGVAASIASSTCIGLEKAVTS